MAQAAQLGPIAPYTLGGRRAGSERAHSERDQDERGHRRKEHRRREYNGRDHSEGDASVHTQSVFCSPLAFLNCMSCWEKLAVSQFDRTPLSLMSSLGFLVISWFAHASLLCAYQRHSFNTSCLVRTHAHTRMQPKIHTYIHTHTYIYMYT